jgi:type II secretory pathway pseudopilin PulG
MTNTKRKTQSTGEKGYMLLYVMALVSLLLIGLSLEAPRIAQQIKREKEQELIHRGNEYKSAIRKYFRKFGQYPSSLDQLDTGSNVRYLRKRYKDPFTGKDDWRIWHFGEIQVNPVNGATTIAQPGGVGQGSAGNTGSAFGASPSPGNNFGQPAGGSAFGGPSAGGAFGQTPGFGPSTTTGPTATLGQSFGSSPGGATFGQQPGAGVGTPTAGSPTGAQSGSDPNAPGATAGSTNGQVGSASGTPVGAGGTQTFGGTGPIVGVSSISKLKSIREVKGKNHYNDWEPFYYNPQLDVNAAIPGAAPPGVAPAGGEAPIVGQPGTGVGTGFGTGNGPTSGSGSGSQPTQPPPTTTGNPPSTGTSPP